jgi:hypothetical protein
VKSHQVNLFFSGVHAFTGNGSYVNLKLPEKIVKSHQVNLFLAVVHAITNGNDVNLLKVSIKNPNYAQ